jgi:transposase
VRKLRYVIIIKSEQIVLLLKALRTTIGRKLLIIWDRLQAHRCQIVREYVEGEYGATALEYWPSYAPDLKLVECICRHLKSHAMPNFRARDLEHLCRHDSSRLHSMQRRATLVTTFWKQAELF